MEQTIEISKRDFKGLCFVNLVDFDALWGHRRNVKGYAEELERFDVKLGEFLVQHGGFFSMYPGHAVSGPAGRPADGQTPGAAGRPQRPQGAAVCGGTAGF